MTRKSKPARSCPLCKPEKFLGNSKGRRPARERRHPDVAQALRES